MTPEDLRRGYETGQLNGWLGAGHPGLVSRELARAVLYGGIRGSLRITGRSREYAGKKTMLYQVCRALLGKDTDNYGQEIGDCFVSGTLVRMADGSERCIEDVVVGDEVATPMGNAGRVVRVIAKPYVGRLVEVRGRGHLESVTCTPDHRMLTDDGWKPAGRLTRKDRLVDPVGLAPSVCRLRLPLRPPDSALPEEVDLDARLGRLIGLYLAFGYEQRDGNRREDRLTFNLPASAHALGGEIVRLLGEVFGAQAWLVSQWPPMMTVLCGSRAVVGLFLRLAGGRRHGVAVPPEVFRAPASVRKAVLRGWLDGRRTRRPRRGPTAQIHRDMLRLCRSLGRRLPAAALPGSTAGGDDWRPRRLRDASATVALRRHLPVTATRVYCLEVEGDHAFVANGYSVHNCVSFGAKNGTEYLSCCDIAMRRESEKWRPVFPPYYYGTGRVYVGGGRLGNGDGSLGSWMATAVQKYGTLFADEANVPKYSGSVAKRWGDPNPKDDLDKWKDTAAAYLVRSAAVINSWEDLVAAIGNGYPCPTASNVGYSMQPGADGFHRQTTSWAHQMCVVAGTTVDGPVARAIERVSVGDLVTGHDGLPHAVAGVHRRPHRGRVVGLRTAGGSLLTLTPEHPVLVAREGRPPPSHVLNDEQPVTADGRRLWWAEAGDVALTDELVRSGPNGFRYLKIRQRLEADHDGPVYNLDVDEARSYLANGIVVHNCFVGVDDGYKNGEEPYAIILNSWGDAHGQLKDFDDGHALPVGVLRVRRKDAEKHIRANETFAYSQLDGFPEQDIDRALYDLLRG